MNTEKKRINIAIDGYSSCGKSTLAKGLAKALGYGYIDSGAMYRAVTLYAIQRGWMADGRINAEALVAALPDLHVDFIHRAGQNITRLNGREIESEIRTMEVSNAVSVVSKVPEVRAKLRVMQQKAAEGGGVVMDGRDIGSVVLPGAELKIFMTADRETRVRRRYEELIAKGRNVNVEQVRANLAERDRLDTQRKENPLVQTADARLLDSTDLTEMDQLNVVLDWVEELVTGKVDG